MQRRLRYRQVHLLNFIADRQPVVPSLHGNSRPEFKVALRVVAAREDFVVIGIVVAQLVLLGGNSIALKKGPTIGQKK